MVQSDLFIAKTIKTVEKNEHFKRSHVCNKFYLNRNEIKYTAIKSNSKTKTIWQKVSPIEWLNQDDYNFLLFLDSNSCTIYNSTFKPQNDGCFFPSLLISRFSYGQMNNILEKPTVHRFYI